MNFESSEAREDASIEIITARRCEIKRHFSVRHTLKKKLYVIDPCDEVHQTASFPDQNAQHWER